MCQVILLIQPVESAASELLVDFFQTQRSFGRTVRVDTSYTPAHFSIQH
jgi:hypothetical protein